MTHLPEPVLLLEGAEAGGLGAAGSWVGSLQNRGGNRLAPTPHPSILSSSPALAGRFGSSVMQVKV